MLDPGLRGINEGLGSLSLILLLFSPGRAMALSIPA